MQCLIGLAYNTYKLINVFPSTGIDRFALKLPSDRPVFYRAGERAGKKAVCLSVPFLPGNRGQAAASNDPDPVVRSLLKSMMNPGSSVSNSRDQGSPQDTVQVFGLHTCKERGIRFP